MKRRKLLATVNTSIFLGLSGCINEIQSAGISENNNEESDCPACPNITVENSVSYESHDVSIDPEGDSETRASLVASDTDVAQVIEDDSEPPDVLQNINFDNEFGIAIRVSTGGADTEFQLLGVNRKDNSSFAIHTCIKRFDGNDAMSIYDRLLIISYDSDAPNEVEIDNSVSGPPEGWEESSSDPCQ